MNKHTKLFVVFLFVTLAVLVVAIVSFSLDVSKDSEMADNSASSAVNANGNQIVQNEDGKYGLEDASGNTLIEPEWEQLQFLSADHLAAVSDTEDGRRMGVLDLDGNVVAPFVYRDIQVITISYYLATYADSQRCVLYDSTFHIMESTVWDSCQYEDARMVLTRGDDTFGFSVTDTGLVLSELDLIRTAGDSTLETNWRDQQVQLLTTAEWSYTADLLQQLMEMLQSGDFTALVDLTTQGEQDTILSVASQIHQAMRRTDRTAYVGISETESGAQTVVWQIDASMRTEEAASQEQTITVTMSKNQQQIWVITGLQFE